MLENSPRHANYGGMSFLKDVSPTGAVYDLIAYIRADRPHNALLWLAACIPPALIFYTFELHSRAKAVPPPPTVTYFESWPVDRSREETIKAITERQIRKDAILAKRREGLKAMAEAIGMDGDKMEQDAIRMRNEAHAAAGKASAAAIAKQNAGGKPEKDAAKTEAKSASSRGAIQ